MVTWNTHKLTFTVGVDDVLMGISYFYERMADGMKNN